MVTTCAQPRNRLGHGLGHRGHADITHDAPAVFLRGTTVVTWRATDPAGNVATATQRVTAELGDDASRCPVGTKVVLGTSASDVLSGTTGGDCLLGRGATTSSMPAAATTSSAAAPAATRSPPVRQ